MGRKGVAILALDQGTTSSRAIVFDLSGRPLAQAQQEFRQIYPQVGWVEHDPEQIWSSQLSVARRALQASGLGADNLITLGLTNQRETVLLWDRMTGEPLGNAIVWQDRRTAERCDKLRREGWEPRLQEKTGLRLDPYFSATKLEWLLRERPGARGLAEQGRLAAGTVDSFLVWRLTGGRSHLTDYSNASRTLLFNLRTLDWDEELLKLFGIPREILPQVVPSATLFGMTEPHWLGQAVPIGGVAGDQQAALFGQACFRPGEAKSTYGTGCFLLMNTGSAPVTSSHGLLSTVAWGVESQVRYALEGSVFIAGAAVQWLRDGLGLIHQAAEVGGLAEQVEDNGGVYFVPAMTGLGAPFWDPYARGLLIGLTRGSNQAHVARATEEAICCQARALLEAMQQDAGMNLPQLRVDGGATRDDFLLQLQADLLGIPVERPAMLETTAWGAAALAGVGSGALTMSRLSELAGSVRVFRPQMGEKKREHIYREWLRAVERAKGWAQ
jgi:glycerol kinase